MVSYDGRQLPDLLSDGFLKMGCYTYNYNHQVIAVVWSKSVYGPWKEKVLFNPWPGPEGQKARNHGSVRPIVHQLHLLQMVQ